MCCEIKFPIQIYILSILLIFFLPLFASGQEFISVRAGTSSETEVLGLATGIEAAESEFGCVLMPTRRYSAIVVTDSEGGASRLRARRVLRTIFEHFTSDQYFKFRRKIRVLNRLCESPNLGKDPGSTPTPEATPNPTPSRPEPPATPTPSPTPTNSPSPNPTSTPTATPTATPTEPPVFDNEAAYRSSINDGPVTWNFTGSYLSGRYVNGSWWVVGPVTIASILPAFDGTRNGQQVDHLSTEAQGLDARGSWSGYSSTLTRTLPYVAPVGKTIIKGVSADTLPTTMSLLNDLRTLNVVALAPASDEFAPGLFGSTTHPQFFAGNLHLERLGQWNLNSIPNMPTLSEASEILSHRQGLLMTSGGGPGMQEMRTRASTVNLNLVARPGIPFAGYGADFAQHASIFMALLNSDASDQAKLPAVIDAIQFGLDVYEATRSPHNNVFGPSGGQFSGLLVFVEFAALMLDHPNLIAHVNGTAGQQFAEHGYLRTGRFGQTLFASENAYTSDQTAYYWQVLSTTSDNSAQADPYGYIDGGNAAPYQRCCNWNAQKAYATIHLMAPILDLLHPTARVGTYFDYIYRYYTEGRKISPDPCAPMSQGGGHNNVTSFCKLDPDLLYFNSPSDFACTPGHACGRFADSPDQFGGPDFGYHDSPQMTALWEYLN